MAEEIATPEPIQQAAPATPVNTQRSDIEAALQSIGGLMPEGRRKELEGMLAATSETPAAPAAPAKPESAKTEPDKIEPVVESPKLDDKGEPIVETSPKPEEPVKKGIFGLNKKIENKTEIVIEKAEDILPVIKSKFGQEIKEIKDLPKFFESAQGWRTEAQRLKTVEEAHKGLIEELESLPPDVIMTMQAAQRGENYKEVLQKTTLPFDINKSFEQQDIKTLVEHYFPKKFTDDDFKEEEKSELLKMAQEGSKIKFEAEKQSHDSKRAVVAETSKKAIQAQKEAATSSVNNLKQRFPDADEEAFNQVKSAVEGGAKKVMSIFFNNDGTLKADAATRLMAAMNFDDLINEASGIASRAAESKANEEFVTRGADKPGTTRTAGQPDQLDPEVKKKLDEYAKIQSQTTGRTF